MKSMSASQAKQNFGALLAWAAREPVHIVRHGNAIATVVPTAWFERNATNLDPRQLARAAQLEQDRAREDKHRRFALSLLLAPAAERQKMINQAQQMVDKWQAHSLCSVDYIEGWRSWLKLPVEELAKSMTSTNDPWAKPMRQNSPFVLPG